MKLYQVIKCLICIEIVEKAVDKLFCTYIVHVLKYILWDKQMYALNTIISYPFLDPLILY